MGKLNIIYLCTPTYSHFASSRTLGVLDGLKEEGHNVIIGSGASIEDYVVEKGFEFFDNNLNPVKRQEEHESIDDINAHQMTRNYLNPENTIEAYKLTKKFCEQKGFDIILSENLCNISPWLSKKLGIPYVVLSFQKFVLPPQQAEFFKMPVERYTSGVKNFLKEEGLDPGLPTPESPVGISPSSDLNLVFSSPTFETRLFDNTEYVGGAKIERDSKFRQQLKNEMFYLEGQNVYYSPGTIFWGRAQLNEVIKLAENHKINIFISQGRLFDTPEKLPKNVKSYDWIDKKILDKFIPEMDLIIAQGGLGLTTRAIRSGVPLLIAPIMPGNFVQAVNVDRYGNGIGLLENKLSLKEAFEEILYNNPKKYKSKALQLQKEFNELGGFPRAIELIKKVAYSYCK